MSVAIAGVFSGLRSAAITGLLACACIAWRSAASAVEQGTAWKPAASAMEQGVAAPVADTGIVDWSALSVEKQITHADHGHVLANTAVWSPDGLWIVYDRRDRGEVFNARSIECVQVESREVRQIYTAPEGSFCGVATWNPRLPQVVFIQGPQPEAEDWPYGISRRRGVVAEMDGGGTWALDAMNYAPPFANGALRGGSHVHVFSPDGQWVSFTYDDELLTRPQEGVVAERPRRTIGVAAPQGPVQVNRNHARNNDGEFFSFVAVRTVAEPQPGTDEIGRAFEEAWIGSNGYRRTDGNWQEKALAFQGEVVGGDGRVFSEVFVADLPQMPLRAGAEPLGGTLTTLPSPPAGVSQRRITFTGGNTYPGIQGPRHWLRSSADGENIAFLMKDEAAVTQLFLVSPRGGEPRQLTHGRHGVASTFNWSPNGSWIACVMDNSVCIVRAETGEVFRLSERRTNAVAPHASACVFSPDGKMIAYLRPVNGQRQIFTVTVPQADVVLNN